MDVFVHVHIATKKLSFPFDVFACVKFCAGAVRNIARDGFLLAAWRSMIKWLCVVERGR